jgi:hypothetical protein
MNWMPGAGKRSAAPQTEAALRTQQPLWREVGGLPTTTTVFAFYLATGFEYMLMTRI